MLSFILAAALAFSTLPPAPPVPHYRLAVEIDPAGHHIVVRGRLEGRPCGTEGKIYLNQALRLTSLRVAGRETPVRMDSTASPAQWTEVTRPLVFECRPGAIEFAYEGTVRDTTARVNLIAADLVELALYMGWYPLDPTVLAFTYDLELTLPADWVVVSGGRVASTHVAGGRRTTRLVSATPGMDVAFVASPHLVVQRARSGAAAVEVYAVPADSALAAAAVRHLGEALGLYDAWYGPAHAGSLPTRFAYSPRGGWGYARLPLMVVSAQAARDWSSRPLGEARIFQGNAHELAHFWWQIADTKTPDDWINEGPAEFSAFAAAGELFGDEIRDSLVSRYRRDAAQAKTGSAITATTNDSPDRYVNHYEKPTLLFAALERRTGRPALLAFLRRFHAAHAGRRDATTAGFLSAARAALGGESAALLQRCLTEAWTDECGR